MANMVTFQIYGGNVVPEIQLPSSATILELKQKIEQNLNVKVARQTLFWSEQILQDEGPIASYGFDSPAPVHLSVAREPSHEFFIDLSSRTRPLTNIRVKESYEVKDLKLKIQKLWGIETKNIALFRLSKKMEDHHLLSSYYVYEGAEVLAEIAVNNPYGSSKLTRTLI